MDIHGKMEGGGVCDNCRDNTEGINCEKCKPGFYKPFSKSVGDVDACVRKYFNFNVFINLIDEE